MTIIVGSSGQTFELEDNYGNEDYHGQVDGDDLTIPIVIQKTLTENEEYMRFEDHDPATTDAKLIIFGDGGIVSAGQSFLEDLNCDDLEINNGIDLKQDAALVFIPVDAQNVDSKTRENISLLFETPRVIRFLQWIAQDTCLANTWKIYLI